MQGSIGRALRLGIRSLVRRPGAPLAAVGTLALGVGAVLTVFALTNALFLRPLPGVQDPERLVRIETVGASSWPNFRDLADASRLLAPAAFSDHLVELEAGDTPRQALGLAVSDDYFEVLGVGPALGRLAPAERGLVVSHRLWRQEMGSDPSALGRELRVNRVALPVLGVAPPGFVGTFRGFQVDLWFPAELSGSIVPSVSLADRTLDRLELVGRLGPGASRETAGAELAAIADRLRREHPSANRDLELTVRPLTGWDEELRQPLLALVTILTLLGGLVLVVAAANVTGLLLARLDRRREELAVHGALGASPAALATVALAEPLILALAGSAAGLALAALAGRAWYLFAPPLPIPVALELGVDHRVVAAAVACSLFVALLAGGPAALRAWRSDPGQTLYRGARGTTAPASRTRRALVIGQIAVSTVLLVVAGLCLRAIERAAHSDPGFAVDGVRVAAAVDLSPLGLDPEEATARIGDSLRRLRDDASVSAAGATTSLPLLSAARTEVGLPYDDRDHRAVSSAVDPGYFAALSIDMVTGRSFDAGDHGEAPAVAVIDETLARLLWPEGEAIGREIRIEDRVLPVVGVVEALRRPGGRSAPPAVYLPLAQEPSSRAHLLVRTDQEIATERFGRELQRLTGGAVPPSIVPLRELLGVVLLPQRMAAAVAGASGLLAALIATFGLHASMVLVMTRRRRELAVRAALGAPPDRLLREVLASGFGPAAAGLFLGLLLAAASARGLESLLAGIEAADGLAFALPALAVTAASLAALWLPARRASRADAVRALREE